jgi:membrane fusion protein (multidrug efflux system)
MNRYERQDAMTAERPPRRRRLWLWLPVVAFLALGVFAAALYFPIAAFQVKGFPAPPPASVSTAKAAFEEWMPRMEVVGTFQPVRGADLSVEVPGIIDQVNFDSGGNVAAGAPLIRLRDTDDVAKLHTLEAARDLAQTNFDRDKAQLDRMLISRAQFDVTAANLQSLQAQVAEQQAIVAKKTLRAPFAGQLGIRAVNAGQYINPGTPVVTLQALDPIYLDFFLPQQVLDRAKVGQEVTVRVDSYPQETFRGRISTIDPKVDAATRNVAVRATFPNRERRLLPGMFATAEIVTGEPQRYITLPQTAITFNPYGNMVYRVTEQTDDKGKQSLVARQTVVTTGQTRGDQIAVLSGLSEGDLIVSAGQTKLQNGATVTVNNAVQPSNDPNPQPRER